MEAWKWVLLITLMVLGNIAYVYGVIKIFGNKEKEHDKDNG